MERLVRSANKLFAVLWLLMIGCSSANEWPLFNADDLSLQNRGDVFFADGKPFTGTVYKLAPNKKDTLAVGGFFAGKEEGEWRKYLNGRTVERRSYHEGKKVGLLEAWWPNGKQKLLYRFSNGEYEGTCQEWNEDGQLIAQMHYKEGHEEGPQKQFYNNGKVRANYIIKDGRRYGLLGTKNCVNVSDSIFKKR